MPFTPYRNWEYPLRGLKPYYIEITTLYDQIDLDVETLYSRVDNLTINDIIPSGTKGELFAHDGTNWVNVPVGPDGFVLGANSSQSNGLAWVTVGGARRQKILSYLDCQLAPPVSPSLGDRYGLDYSGAAHPDWISAGADSGDLVEWDGVAWTATKPVEGWRVYVDDEDQDRVFVDDPPTYTDWEARPTAENYWARNDTEGYVTPGVSTDAVVVNHMQLVNTVNPAHEDRMLFWDIDANCPAFYNDRTEPVHQIGRELWLRGYNNSGVDILNGELVYISGWSGSDATIAKANNTVLSQVDALIGMATENILNNERGELTTFGQVNGINTSGETEGIPVYLGINGDWTTTEPASPAYARRVGVIGRVDGISGSIFIGGRSGSGAVENHASRHTDGTDDIQSATNAQKGLATAAHITAIEANTAHAGTSNIHFTEASIDHINIQNTGTNTHAQIDTHIADVTKHREINDAGTGTTDLWSASKISSEIAAGGAVSNLQTAYAGGNTIVTDAGNGILDVSGTERINLTTSNSDFNAIAIDSSAGGVDIDAAGAVTVDAGASLTMNAVSAINASSEGIVSLTAESGYLQLVASGGDAATEVSLSSNGTSVNAIRAIAGSGGMNLYGATGFTLGTAGTMNFTDGTSGPHSLQDLLSSGTDRVKWEGNWTSTTYDANDMVFDDGWTMIANKTTTEKAAPAAVGSEQYVYTGTSPTTTTAAKTLIYGTKYTSVEPYFLNGYRVYTVAGNTYSVYYTVDDQTTELLNFIGVESGWREFSLSPKLILGGTEFALSVMVKEPDPTPTTWSANYNYTTPDDATPAAGQMIHPNKPGGASPPYANIIRIHKTDNDTIDQSANLTGLVVGDIINGPNLSWSIQSVTDQGAYVDFQVAPAQQDVDGVNNFTFETVSTKPITILVDTGYWSTNPEIESLYSIDGAPFATTQDAYGIDLLVQEASISADWDLVSYGGSVGSGGGGGGLSDAPSDTTFYGRKNGLWVNPVTGDTVYSTDHDHVNSLQDVISHVWSPGGCATGFELTDNANYTINLTAGSAVLRSVDEPHGDLRGYAIGATTNLALTPDATNYIMADYNAGSPVMIATTDLAGDVFSDNTKAIVYAVNVLTGTPPVLNVIDVRSNNVDYITKNGIKDYRVHGFEHASGALIADEGSMQFSITASTFFILNTAIDSVLFDTSAADTFEYLYNNGPVWTRITGQSVIDYDQYNNAGTLTSLTNNNYGVHYVYAVLNEPTHYKVVYGTDSYSSLAEALEAPRPSVLPSDLDALSTGVYLGRIVTYENDAVNFAAVTNAFETSESTGSPTVHNNLSGLQGGTVGEYYHLTNVEYSGLSGITAGPTVTREYTGFKDPENVIVTYNTTTNRIELTGTVEAYWHSEQVTALNNTWVSEPLTDTYPAPAGGYFLYYNGSSFVWSDSPWEFYMLQIAFVAYNTAGTFLFALREPHGLMPWEVHRANHDTLGTYRESGGDFANYLANSTTPTDRRPTISATQIYDEDIPTTLTAHSTQNNYTWLYLIGASGDANVITGSTEVVPTTGITPQYNEWTGTTWQLTALPNNDYMSVWVFALPVTADAESQDVRYVFMTGQNTYGSLAAAQGENPAALNLSVLDALATEWTLFGQIIIHESGAGDWEIEEINIVSGTREGFSSGPSGSYLSAVTTDTTLTGTGTASNPLGIEQSDSIFRIVDDGDNTKEIAFQASAISAATTRTITMPDADVNLGDVAAIGSHIADGTIHFTDASVLHNNRSDINTGDYIHLTSVQYSDLTDTGDSTLHYHASDRNRTNHTGTQTMSTISDAGNLATLDTVTNAYLAANAVENVNVADDAIGIAELSATGTASANTYLQGDNTWGNQLAGGANLNYNWDTVILPGAYIGGTGTTNKPSGFSSESVFVYTAENGSYIVQTAIDSTGDKLATRRSNNTGSTWSTWQEYSSSAGSTPTLSKSITIESPASGDDITMFFTDVAITVTQINLVSTGTSPSTSYLIGRNTSRSGVASNIQLGTSTSTTGEEITSISGPIVPAGSYVWIEISAASGTDVTFHVTITYTEN